MPPGRFPHDCMNIKAKFHWLGVHILLANHFMRAFGEPKHSPDFQGAHACTAQAHRDHEI
jgi:hypothetical protein